MPLLALETETVKLEKAAILEHSLADILVKLSGLKLTVVSHRWVFCCCFCCFSEDQAVFTRQDSGRNEKEVSQVTHENEPDSGSQPRPAVSSGYSKQFQKSLPPRFQRQQVTNQFIK